MFRTTANFDKLLDKATSNLRLEPDWPTILQICDQIRQADCQPKYALAAIKKKLYNPNPHIALFGLLVLESCVKNCGNLIHDEIGTKAYMEQLRDLVKSSPDDNVKNKVLELIQAWAYAFRNSPKYRAVQDTVNIMKAENYKFPVLKESDAMFSADTAPEWADGEVCHRCRVAFSMMQRKHHCRACGQVFCGQCSAKTSTLPKFGIEKEVRVCEACHDMLNKPMVSGSKMEGNGEQLPAEYLASSLAQQTQAPPRKSEEELREEEELQLALALSQSEAEEKEKAKKRNTSAIIGAANRSKSHSPPMTKNERSASPAMPAPDEEDPELARYMNRKYWEKRDRELNTSPQSQQPSAPTNLASPMINSTPRTMRETGVADPQLEEFVAALRTQVEIFVNRMKSNSSRGRSITNDSSVQTLFMTITTMHSQLLRYIGQQDDSRVYYEGLQDKLAQVKDARAALDALRDEHAEKLRLQAEENERLRQAQMHQKLGIMRKQKNEYLQYQREVALMSIQAQEREMQMRQEQQRLQYLMPQQPASYSMPQQSMGYSMPPQSYADNSPVHYPPFQGPSGPPGPPPGYQDFPRYQGQMMGQRQSLPPQMQGPDVWGGQMGQQGPMQAANGPRQAIPQMPGQMLGNTRQSLPAQMHAGQMQGPPGQMQGLPRQMQGPGQIQVPPGQMQGSPGQMQGPPGQMQGPHQMQGPSGQMQGPPGQMHGPNQMQGPLGQMQGPPGQMQGPPNQMQGPPGQMQGPPGQMQGPNQMQGPPGQMQGPPAQMQGPPGQMPGPPGQMQGPNQMQGPPSQMQGLTGQMQGLTMGLGPGLMGPPGGYLPQNGQPQQPGNQQRPSDSQSTEELISFD